MNLLFFLMKIEISCENHYLLLTFQSPFTNLIFLVNLKNVLLITGGICYSHSHHIKKIHCGAPPTTSAPSPPFSSTISSLSSSTTFTSTESSSISLSSTESSWISTTKNPKKWNYQGHNEHYHGDLIKKWRSMKIYRNDHDDKNNDENFNTRSNNEDEDNEEEESGDNDSEFNQHK